MAPGPVSPTRRGGIALAFVTALVSGVAVYVNGFGVRAWREAGVSTTAYTTAKNLVAAVALGAIALLVARRRGDRTSLRTLPGPARPWLLAIGVIGGSVPFVLFFEGLSRASSTQAALIHKSLLIWVALLAIPLLGERLNGWHLGAMGLLVAGQVVIAGGVTDVSLGSGEVMVLAATLLWSVEVVMAKHVLHTVAPLTVGVARMGIGSAVLVVWVLVTGGLAGMAALSAADWGWIALTGGTLTAYVGTWYAALSRAQALDVTAVLVFGAVITALLGFGIEGTALPSLVGLGLVGAGAAAAAAAAHRGTRRGAPSPGSTPA